MSEHNQTNPPADGPLWGLLAEVSTPTELVSAAAKVRAAGYTQWDCYSPFPVHGIDRAMGTKPTILPVLVFMGGITGTGLAILMQWWMNAVDWPWIVSGKPYFSLPANIPIAFELTILLASLTAFFGMWALNKLPQVWHPLFRSDRFAKVTNNGFFLAIQADDDKFDREATEALLKEAGATAIEAVHLDADPKKKKMPRQIPAFIAITAVAALVPFACIAKARTSKSSEPHYHIIPDMDFQPKAQAQQASALLPDGRVDQMPVEGTVARGELKADDHFYRGIVDGAWATTFPEQVPPSKESIERGHQRFNIYCSPCHGLSGYGNGMVAQRAEKIGSPNWTVPSNLHQEYIIRQPHGQIFNTISNGIRNMPSYGAQIPEADRWAIVMYVRALQRSQHATVADVPPTLRQTLR
ncbi:MAG TPA: quinol:electron acceptor oxidoreductase subunit ActD [Kofleriaceae bacterium]|nr:quinol:electron acceptor oxidoreductase subunit ActD [Kofleriaceae bacterium]